MSTVQNIQDGFRYQFLAGIYVILKFSDRYNFTEAYIERLNSEDLQLVVGDGTSKKETYDFQFKKKKGIIDLDFFTSCIAKFDAGGHDKNVVSKLLNDELAGYYLFTNSRPEQFADALNIIADKETFLHRDGNLPKLTEKKKLITALGKIANPSKSKLTKQAKKRNDFLINQVKEFNSGTDIASALERIFVLDQMDRSELYYKITIQLSTRHIPTASHQHLIRELLDIVQNEIASNKNVIPDFERTIISYRQSLPSTIEGYQPIKDAPLLLASLKSEKVLLLTGVPLCGKSQTAKYIAAQYMKDNPELHFAQMQNVDEVNRFLSDETTEPRLCILEDPFGQFFGRDTMQVVKRVENMLNYLPTKKERYIIITSNNIIVSAIGESIGLLHYKWVDITITDRFFLKNIWTQIATERKVTDKVVSITNKLLDTEPEQSLLQPGQIDYLGRNISRLGSSISDASIRQLATFNAANIEHVIKENGPKHVRIMIIMGLTSTTLFGPTKIDLDYIFGSDTSYLPGINATMESSVSTSLIGKNNTEKYAIKEYSPLKEMGEDYSDIFETYFDLNYLRLAPSQMMLFTHSIYQDGSKLLFNGTFPDRVDRLLGYAQKAIGGLNVRIALNTIKNLYLLIDHYNGHSELLARVCNIAWSALGSTFVSVRDASMLFLVRFYGYLDSSLQKELIRVVSHRGPSSDILFWQNGIPFVPDAKFIMSNWDDRREYFDRKKIIKKWKGYLKDRLELEPREALSFLKGLEHSTRGKKKRISFEIEPLLKFLYYEENAIREQAAFLIAASCTVKDIKLIKDIFLEDNPFVNYQLLKGLMRAWPYLNDQTVKVDLLEFMKQNFENPFVVLNAIDLFTQFDAGHTSYTFDWRDDIEECAVQDMWFLWSELIVVLFKHLPKKNFINTNRFIATLLDGPLADVTLKVKVLIAFISWLPLDLEDDSYSSRLSDIAISYFMSFIDKIDAITRLGLSNSFIWLGNKGVTTRLLRELVFRWDILSDNERQAIIENVRMSSSMFLKSVVLTGKNVPEDLQSTILGVSILGMDTEQIIKTLDETLLIHCLSSLYVNPTSRDYDHKDLRRWDPVLGYYVNKPESTAFPIAIKTMFVDLLVANNKRKQWSNPKKIIKECLAFDIGREVIFDFLLEDISSTHHSWSGPYFHLFFSSIEPALHENYALRLAENLEAISYASNTKCIPPKALPFVNNKTKIDYFFMLFSKHIAKDKERDDAYGDILTTCLQEREIRTFEAVEALQRFTKKNPAYFNDVEIALLEKYRCDMIDLSRVQQKNLQEKNDRYFLSWTIID